jgi:anti-sigma regulatory factor (Ser/Thr protein kinase)
VVVTVATPEKLLEIQFPACSEQAQQVRDAVRGTLRGQGCGEEYVYTAALAVDEAVCNIVRHAYCGVGTGEIVLQILHLENTLAFHLIDFAPPIDPAKVKSRDLADVRPGGLGVYLIRQIMDTLALEKPPEGAGNMLVMTRKLECR